MIISNLNFDQFLAAFGKHEYVRDFSHDAIEHILDFVAEQQRVQKEEGWDIDTQVTDYFQGAEELTEDELISQFSHKYDDLSDILNNESYTELNNGNYVSI